MFSDAGEHRPSFGTEHSIWTVIVLYDYVFLAQREYKLYTRREKCKSIRAFPQHLESGVGSADAHVILSPSRKHTALGQELQEHQYQTFHY